VATDDRVAKFLYGKGSRDGALGEDTAAISLVATANDETEPAKRIQGTGYDRLGNAELFRQSANRMRRRLEINRQQNRHLSGRQVVSVGTNQIERHIVPEAQGLAWPQFDGHEDS
jgi:hypothetical protein